MENKECPSSHNTPNLQEDWVSFRICFSTLELSLGARSSVRSESSPASSSDEEETRLRPIIKSMLNNNTPEDDFDLQIAESTPKKSIKPLAELSATSFVDSDSEGEMDKITKKKSGKTRNKTPKQNPY